MPCEGYDKIDNTKYYTQGTDDDKAPKDAYYGYITECMDSPTCAKGFKSVKTLGWEGTDNIYCGDQITRLGTWQKKNVCKRDWDAFMTDDRKVKCCTGEYSGISQCSPDYCLSSDKCHAYMTTYCSNEANFFTPNCRTWLENLKGDATKDQVASGICHKYKDSTDEDKRIFCACYNPDLPASLEHDPVLRTQVLCLNENCVKAEALKPAQNFPLNCDINYVVCTQKDIAQTLLDNGTIDKESFENKCGITIDASGKIVNTTTNNVPGTTVPEKPAEPSDSSDSSDSSTKSFPGLIPNEPWYKQPLVWGSACLVLICLFLVIFFLLR